MFERILKNLTWPSSTGSDSSHSRRSAETDMHHDPEDHKRGHNGDFRSGMFPDADTSQEVQVQALAKDGSSLQKRRRVTGELRSAGAQASSDHDREQPRTRKRDQISDLHRDLDVLKKRLHSNQQELVAADSKTTAYEKAIRTLQREKDSISRHLNSKIDDQVAKVHSAERKVAEVEDINRKQEEEIRLLRDRFRASEDKQSRMAMLLEERTSDLKGAQTFLTAADIYSGAEIIKMVESLNAEIFQSAAFMAELLVDDSMMGDAEERAAKIRQHQKTLDLAKQEIGSELFAYLSDKSTEVRADPLPFQLALQQLLASWCSYNIESFCFEPMGNDLRKLYKRIRSSEAQAVAGRWRAITSAQLRLSDNRYGPKFVLNLIGSLLCLCGWSASSLQSRKSFSTIESMISSIEKLYRQLKTAMKEGITTADMEVFCARPGDIFDNRMEDTYEDTISDSERGKSVLCTVGLGVHKSVTKRVQSRELTNQVDVLLKVKVALPSVLFDTNSDSPKDEGRMQEQDGKL